MLCANCHAEVHAGVRQLAGVTVHAPAQALVTVVAGAA